MKHSIVKDAWREAMRPPARETVYSWAEKNVKLPHSARSQRFDRNLAPWLISPFDAAIDNRVKRIVIPAPVGGAKTTFFEILIAYIICEDPGPTIYTSQTDETSKEWAETRFKGVIDSCSEIQRLLPLDRHQKRKTEIIFPHMPIFIGGANMSAAQEKSMRWVLGDEVWRWKKGMVREFEARLHDRWNGRYILVSQGGIEGDDFHVVWRESDQAEWHFQCPQCKEWQPFKWSQIRYDETKDANGEWDWNALKKSVRYVCRKCAHDFSDDVQIRRQLASSGKYFVSNPKHIPGTLGFHYNALTVWWIEWGKLVIEWIKAQEAKQNLDLQPLMQFIQKRLAEFWKEEEVVPYGALIGSGYLKSDYVDGQIWEGERFRFFTLDRQRDHFWGVIRAWKTDGSSRLIWEGQILTWSDILNLQKQYKIKAKLVFMDAQFDTGQVYEHCSRNDWIAIHGSGQSQWRHYKNGKTWTAFISEIQKARIGIGRYARYFFFSNEKIKDRLARLRSGQSVLWEIPNDISNDYVLQIDSEIKKEVVDKKTKAVTRRWVKIRDNHLWDCECMQVAVAYALNVFAVEPKTEEKEDQEIS